MSTNAEDAASSLPLWREYAKQKLNDLRNTLTEELDALKEEQEEQGPERMAEYTPTKRTGRLYWLIVTVYLAAQSVLGIVDLFFLRSVVTPVIPINIGLLVFLLQIFHLAMSFQRVQVEDLAGIDIFGRPLFIPKTGLYIIPWLIMTYTRASRNYKDVRFPGPADKIFRVSLEVQKERRGGDVPPAPGEPGYQEGLVRPIYVTTGEPRRLNEEDIRQQKELRTNPLDEQLNVEVSYFVRYRPESEYGGIFRIRRNLSAKRGDIDPAIKDLMREQSERDIKAIIAGQTTATIIENWDLVNEVFRLKLQLAVLPLAVDVAKDGCGLDDLNPSHELNASQRDARQAAFERIRTITEADAKGEAYRREYAGLADGYETVMKKAEVSGESVIASETLKVKLPDTDQMVMGTGGIEQLFGLVKAGQSMLSRNPKGPGTDAKPAPEKE